MSRAVNEVWRTYEMKHKPAVFLDLRVPPGSFDVNLSPDKREVGRGVWAASSGRHGGEVESEGGGHRP
jgi:hypothetical protein